MKVFKHNPGTAGKEINRRMRSTFKNVPDFTYQMEEGTETGQVYYRVVMDMPSGEVQPLLKIIYTALQKTARKGIAIDEYVEWEPVSNKLHMSLYMGQSN
jgi:hypothetical protein